MLTLTLFSFMSEKSRHPPPPDADTLIMRLCALDTFQGEKSNNSVFGTSWRWTLIFKLI